MKLFRTCLLLLLSLVLPLQAALAAGAGGCLRHASQGPQTAVAVVQVANKAQPEHSACAQHQPSAAATPAADDKSGTATDASCSNCGLCCLATALPSQGLQWQAACVQQAHPLTPFVVHLSTVARTLERPPRAVATFC